MHRRWLATGITAVMLVAGCSGSDDNDAAPVASTTSTEAAPTTTAAVTPLRVLVTNDDGVGAPGIDALVEAVRKLPGTEVTVVAPVKNQSGTGGKVTSGALVVKEAKTASGFAAHSVAGFPADSIVWALDKKGIARRPHVVLSGINAGQNIGVLIDLSGTVGAARAAARRGIPALAVSQGLATQPDYPTTVKAALAWLAQHRAELLARDTSSTAPSTVTNINAPTCPTGTPRGVVLTPLAGADAKPFDPVDCVTAYASPSSDVDAFLHGYVAQTDNVSLTPASG